MSITSIILLSCYVLLLILTAARIILENKNPLKTHSYLLIILVLPGIGLFIYYFFGVNLRKEKLFIEKEKNEKAFIKEYLENYKAKLESQHEEIDEKLQSKGRLPFLFFNNSHSVFTLKNKIDFLFGGEKKYPALLEELKKANHHIHIEYYIFYAKDVIGKAILEILCAKAQAGIEVRLLVDGFGSKIYRRHIRQLKDAGAEIYFFRPMWTPKYFTKSNYRNHRKIAVIDGKTAFVGGINIADYYDNSKKNKTYWADLHAKIQGDAVHSLQLLFYSNWRFATGKEFGPLEKYLAPHTINSKITLSIVGSNASGKSPAIMDAYFTMITTAVKEVLITTPYFIPNEAMLKSILVTAKSGVEVKILLPKVSDGHMVQMACLSYVEELLQNNVRVFLYKKGMIHSKYMVVDSSMSTLGTTNFDERSFNINSEVNAFIFNEEKSLELKKAFEQDLLLSEEITLDSWLQRSGFQKLQQSIFRMVSPLL